LTNSAVNAESLRDESRNLVRDRLAEYTREIVFVDANNVD